MTGNEYDMPHYHSDMYESESAWTTADQMPKGASVIIITGKDISCLNTIVIEPRMEDSKVEVKDSDVEGYQKLVIVSNEDTEAVETYYVRFTEPALDVSPVDVTDEGNAIVSMTWMPIYNEDNEKTGHYLEIVGEADALTAPVFVFSSEVESQQYTPVTEENGYTGKLTVTCGGQSTEYFVKYRKGLRTVGLTDVKDAKNFLSSFRRTWVSEAPERETTSEEEIQEEIRSSSETESVMIYEVYGALAEPSDALEFVFSEEITGAWKLNKVTDKLWNYEIVVNYKGEEQVIPFKYEQLPVTSLLPSRGYYYAGANRGKFSRIEYTDNTVLLTLGEEDFPDALTLSTVVFGQGDKYYEDKLGNRLTHKLEQKEDGKLQLVAIANETAEVFRADVKLVCEPRPETVTDGDNSLYSYDLIHGYKMENAGEELNAQETYLYIRGDNEKLQNLKVTFSSPEVTGEYTPATEGTYAGSLKVTYPGGTVTYPVRYEQQSQQKTTSVRINRVKAENAYLYPYVDYSSSEDRGDIFYIRGMAKELPANTVFTFNVEGVTAGKLEKAPEDSQDFNYVLSVTNGGKQESLRIMYEPFEESDYAPDYVSYYNTDENGMTTEFNSKDVRIANGTVIVGVKQAPDQIRKNRLSFSRYSDNDYSLRYEVQEKTEGEQTKTVLDVQLYGWDGYTTMVSLPVELAYEPVPVSVTDGENYIIACDAKTDEETGETYIAVVGENETLASPVFTFSYDAAQEYKDGALTVKSGAFTKTYAVRYTQDIHTLTLQKVEQEGSFVTAPKPTTFNSEMGEIQGYYVYGSAEELSKAAKYTFDVPADAVTSKVVRVKGTSWTQEIYLKYKGEKQTIYLQYSKLTPENVLPYEFWYYLSEEEDASPVYVNRYNSTHVVEGKLQIDVKNKPSEIKRWSTYSSSQYVYEAVQQEGAWKLQVYEGVMNSQEGMAAGTLEKGVLVMTVDMVLRYLPELASVTAKDNTFVEGSISREWTGNGYTPYISVTGEADALTEPVFRFADADVTAVYTAGSESENYVGSVTVKSGEDETVLPVKYQKGLHQAKLTGVVKEGAYYELEEGSSYESSYYTGRGMRVYTVRGFSDYLPSDVKFTFDVTVDPGSVRFAAEDNWYNEVTFTYKGEEQTIGILYEQAYDMYAPYEAVRIIRDEDGDETDRDYMNFSYDSSDKSVSLIIKDSDPADLALDALEFTGNYNCEYKLAGNEEAGYTVKAYKKQKTQEAVEEGQTAEPVFMTDYALKLVYSPYLNGAEVDEKYISCNMRTKSQGGNVLNYVYVYDEEQTLAETVKFTSSDQTAQVVYNPKAETSFRAEEGTTAGTVTVTSAKGGYKVEYPVVYKQVIDPFWLEGMTEEGNYISENVNHEWTEDSSERYFIIKGLKDTLDVNKAKPAFDREVTDPELKITPVEGKEWSHEITFTYKGVPQVVRFIYVPLEEKDVYPKTGNYQLKTAEDENEETRDTTLYSFTVSWTGEAVLAVHAHAMDLIHPDRIEFGGRNEFKYKVQDGKIQVLYEDQVAKTLALKYQYKPVPSKVLEADGTEFQINSRYDTYYSYYNEETGLYENIEYFYIRGEAESLDGATVQMADASLKAELTSSTDYKEYPYRLTVKDAEGTELINCLVQYQRDEPSLSIEEIHNGEEVLQYGGRSYAYDESGNYVTDENGNYVQKYEYSGLEQALVAEPTFVFITSFTDAEAKNVDVKVQKASEGKAWNYEITTTYKGITQKHYLKYTQRKISLRLSAITEAGNELTPLQEQYTVEYDDDNRPVNLYSCFGTRELGNAQFTVVDDYNTAVEGAEVASKAVTNSDNWNYEITITYKGYSQKHYLKYTQKKNLNLTKIVGYENGEEMKVTSVKDAKDAEGNSIRLFNCYGYQNGLSEYDAYTYEDEEGNLAEEAYTSNVTESDNAIWDYSLTVTYEGYEQTIYLKYTQKKDLSLKQIKDGENVVTYFTPVEDVADNEGNEVRCFTCSGSEEALGTAPEFIFLDGDNEVAADQVAAAIELVDANDSYNYKITVTYDGYDQYIYLNYTKAAEDPEEP